MSFGAYEILSNIASGGMGAVYRARHTQTNREVALKVLLPQLAGDAEFIKRFKHEVTALAQLKHPNIVEIVDAGQVGGQHFMAMAYLGGGSLLDELNGLRKAGQSMPVRRALEIARQVASALEHAHSRQIVHRDIKPANILNAGDGRYVLTDFGIVKGAQLTTVTQNFAAIGTPDYMSPEQAQGLPVDGRSDVYSLGVLLFEMLAGRVPFRAENTPALLYKHVHENAPDLKTLRGDVPDGVRQLVERALTKKRDQRIGSARELGAAIDRLLQNPDRKVAIAGERKFPVALVGLLGAAAVAGIGLGAWSLGGGGAGPVAGSTATPAPNSATKAPESTGGPRATVTALPGGATTAPGTERPASTAPVSTQSAPGSTVTPVQATQPAAGATSTTVVTLPPSSTPPASPTNTRPPPTATPQPTATTAPTSTPTSQPTSTPTSQPTATPTKAPTSTPTKAPTATSTPPLLVTKPPLFVTLVPIKTLVVFIPTATPTPKPFVVVPITPIVVIRIPTSTPKP